MWFSFLWLLPSVLGGFLKIDDCFACCAPLSLVACIPHLRAYPKAPKPARPSPKRTATHATTQSPNPAPQSLLTHHTHTTVKRKNHEQGHNRSSRGSQKGLLAVDAAFRLSGAVLVGQALEAARALAAVGHPLWDCFGVWWCERVIGYEYIVRMLLFVCGHTDTPPIHQPGKKLQHQHK